MGPDSLRLGHSGFSKILTHYFGRSGFVMVAPFLDIASIMTRMASRISPVGHEETRHKSSWPSSWMRIFVVALLFLAGASYEAVQTTSVFNPDIWAHLRTGTWILQNHSVPRMALFTQRSNLIWIVPDWGFDLLSAFGVRLFGLRAVPLLLMVFRTALAIATFLLLQGGSRKFWPAVGLTAVTQFILLGLALQPAIVSALFFAMELRLLLETRKRGNFRRLRWLPLLFVGWANLDGQFMYGLMVLSLYVAVSLIEWGPQKLRTNHFTANAPVGSIFLYCALSALATLLSPYFYAPYQILFKSSIGNLGKTLLDALHSMSFRQPQHYALLLLAMLAFFALGRQRSRDWFKIGMMVICSAYAFHWQQNMWFLALPAAAFIADDLNPGSILHAKGPGWRSLRLERIAVATLTAILFVAVTTRIPSEKDLLSRIAKDFPVKAADYVHDNHLPGPLYNPQAWGSFLIWYLPDYSVSIDGRVEMYGREINELFFATSTAIQPPNSDPTFSSSRTFLLKRESRLCDTIAHLPGFNTLYQDDLAVVIVRQGDTPYAVP